MNLIKSNYKLYLAIVSLIVVILQVIATKNILVDVYKWQLTQRESVEGGIAIIVVLMMILLVNFSKRTRIRILLIAIISLLYLFSTNLFLPVVVGVIYFEMIISIGIFIKAIVSKKQAIFSIKIYLEAFVVGFSGWAIVVLLFSLIGLGTINDLRVITILLFAISLIKGIHKPFTLFLIKRFEESSLTIRNLCSILWVLILILLTKSNRAIDYDSLWYGLRPEYVLVGQNSFFDSLGLVQFVHYYPKLFEVFTLPVSGLKDYSYIYTLNILFFILSLLAIYSVINLLIKNKVGALFGVILIASIPAFANIAATAKPDLFSITFTFIGLLFILSYLFESDQNGLGYSLVALIISLSAKSTSFLYVPVIVVGILAAILIVKFKSQIEFSKHIKNLKNSFWLICISIFIFLLVCYRTFKLTGYPVYPTGLGIWNTFGFEAKYPFNDNKSVDGLEIHFSISGILERWVKLFVDPKDYGHIIMLWTGQICLVLLIILLALIAFRWIKKFDLKCWILTSLSIPVILVGLFFATFMRNGGDGNYFIIPMVYCFIYLYVLIFNLTTNLAVLSRLKYILMLVLPLQLVVTFISHSSWYWGTQEFDFDFNFYLEEDNSKILGENDLLPIEEYILNNPGFTRSLGLGGANGHALHFLPTRIEELTGISSDHLGNSQILSSFANFNQFLKWAEIDYLILSKEEINNYILIKDFIAMLDNKEGVHKLETIKYVLYDITSLEFENMGDLQILDGWYANESGMRWINKEALATGIAGERGEIQINGIVPNENADIAIDIFINDEYQSTHEYTAGDFQIQLKVNPDEPFTIRIKSNKSFVPSELSDSEDVRELSLLITKVNIN